MILVKDLLGVAYDASVLTTLDPNRDNLGSIAEDGKLIELILSTLDTHDRYSLTAFVPVERRAELSDKLGSAANAADYIPGSGWEAVVQWVIDLLPRDIRELEA